MMTNIVVYRGSKRTVSIAEQDRELIARGVLVPPRKRRSTARWPLPPGNIPDEVVLRLLQEERENR